MIGSFKNHTALSREARQELAQWRALAASTEAELRSMERAKTFEHFKRTLREWLGWKNPPLVGRRFDSMRGSLTIARNMVDGIESGRIVVTENPGE